MIHKILYFALIQTIKDLLTPKVLQTEQAIKTILEFN
jgi:hypothetical protein